MTVREIREGNADGEASYTCVFSEYQRFGALYRANKIEVSNVQTEKRSVITWTARQLDAALEPGVFSATRSKTERPEAAVWRRRVDLTHR